VRRRLHYLIFDASDPLKILNSHSMMAVMVFRERVARDVVLPDRRPPGNVVPREIHIRLIAFDRRIMLTGPSDELRLTVVMGIFSVRERAIVSTQCSFEFVVFKECVREICLATRGKS